MGPGHAAARPHLDAPDGINTERLRVVLRRFVHTAADAIEADHPALAGKLRQTTPHWMRHTHAPHALANGATLTTVRDNLRHASIATTSVYLDDDEVQPTRQIERICTPAACISAIPDWPRPSTPRLATHTSRALPGNGLRVDFQFMGVGQF
jgi:Phage integrase family